jgi:hypothetical protein
MGITKIEAAERQLDAAIRLFFANDDWIAVHTLAAASGRILRDLAEQRGSSAWERMNEHIVPEKRNYVWGQFNKAAANFFKHADRDPDALLEGIDPIVNDHFIQLNCILFNDLQGRITRSMALFLIWYIGAYPDIFPDILLEKRSPELPEVKRLLVSLQQDLPRAEQLDLWEQVLKLPHLA